MVVAALRDLQWRWKRFVIAIVGVSLVFAMGLVMTGLTASFSLEVDDTLRAIGADSWVVSDDASGPFTSFVPIPAAAGGPDASPAMVLRQSVNDGGAIADIVVVAVEPGRLGAPQVDEGAELAGPGEAVVDDSFEAAELGGDLSFGGRTFRVVGKVSGQRLYAGLPVVYIPLADAQSIAVAGQPLVTAFLHADGPAEVQAGLKEMSRAEVKDDLLRPLGAARSSIGFVRVLLWIVAATIIGSMLYLQAMERTRDFAVFKATGVSTVQIGVGLALQAVFLSLTSAVLAGVLAAVIAPAFPLPVVVPPSAYLLLPVITVVVGLAASVVALRRAATVQPALAFGA